MLLQALSTRVFDFQIEHRHISIEAYRNYLLNIYLDEVERMTKIVLITGGNKGLGYASAEALKALGYKVYIGSQ